MKKIIALSILLLFVLKLNAQTSPIIRIVFMQTSPCCDRPPKSLIIKRYGQPSDDTSDVTEWMAKNQRRCIVSDEMFACIEKFVESNMDTSYRLYKWSQSNPYQWGVTVSTKEEWLQYSSLSKEEHSVYFQKLIHILENCGDKNEIKMVIDAIRKI